MSPLPSKPRVTILGSTAMFVGHEATVQVEVTAEHPTDVDFIDVRVRGREGWSIGSGKHRIAHHVDFPDLVARVMSAGTLPAGLSTFLARFTLPAGTPPSHEISPAYARLTLRVHVSIPWWPDGRYTFDLRARVPPGGPVRRTPVAARSNRSDAPADEPRLELGLGSTRLIAGETVVGSVAVFHLADRKARDVSLTLTPTFVLHRFSRTRERTGSPLSLKVTIPAGEGGAAVPFRMQLPDTMTPTFVAATHELRWVLEARAGSLLGGKVGVALPIEIVDAAGAATTAPLTVAPALGDERIAAVFAGFASSAGWRTVADDASLVIERERPGAEHRIAYVYRGEAGAFLVSRIGVPSLGLALSVAPGSAVRHLFFHDVEVGDRAWDREHLVSARAPAQAVPVLTAVVPALIGAPELGRLVRWDDDELVFERSASQVDAADLARIAQALDLITFAVGDARAKIAPPADVELDLAAWHALARSLDAELGPGNLSITGTLDTTRVELALVWVDGQPHHVAVELGDPARASAQARAITLGLPQPAAHALTTPILAPGLDPGVNDRLVAQLAQWADDVVELRIADGTASAALRLAATPAGAPRADAEKVRALVGALRGVLLALEPGASPYR